MPPPEGEQFSQSLAQAEEWWRTFLGKTFANKAKQIVGFIQRENQISAHDIWEQINGKSQNLKAYAIFNTFSGSWHGQWKGKKIIQHWRSSLNNAAPQHSGDGYFSLRFDSVQSVRMDDGYGWNVIAIPSTSFYKRVILGSVVHTNRGKTSYIVPHIGIILNGNSFAWITPSQIYLEMAADDKYHIKEFTYTFEDDLIKILKEYNTVYYH